jgi:hypothetical protein
VKILGSFAYDSEQMATMDTDKFLVQLIDTAPENADITGDGLNDIWLTNEKQNKAKILQAKLKVKGDSKRSGTVVGKAPPQTLGESEGDRRGSTNTYEKMKTGVERHLEETAISKSSPNISSPSKLTDSIGANESYHDAN